MRRLKATKLAWLSLCLCFLGAGRVSLRGDLSGSWRLFSSRDGLHDSYSTSITWSPRNNVLIKHGEFDSFTIFDGYETRTLPSLGTGGVRIYESRSGQIWTPYSLGLAEMRNRKWILHPIDAIAKEMQTNLIRQVRQIPLVPAELDHVFFLVSDRLMEFHTATGRQTVILRAADTGLELFIDMLERQDGSLWLTGRRGLLRIPGPVRQITAGSPSEEFLMPRELNLRDLHRPIEDAAGLTLIAERSLSEPRSVIRFDGAGWKAGSPSSEKVRFAWKTADGAEWSQSINKVVRSMRGGGGDSKGEGEQLTAGQFFDVAGTGTGVYWMATSDGAVRFAPLPWQIPVGMIPEGVSLYALFRESSGDFWIAASGGMIQTGSSGSRHIPWPADFEAIFRPGESLFSLPDGRLLLNTPERVATFDPRTERFQFVEDFDGITIRKVVGRFAGPSLAVLTSHSGVGDWSTVAKWTGDAPVPWCEKSVFTGGIGEMQFVEEAADGVVWMGGSAGLFKCESGHVDSLKRIEDSPSDRGSCFAEVGNGSVWFGAGDQIFGYNGRKWLVIATGFDRVNSLMRSRDGSVWVAANNGVWRLHKGTWLSNGPVEGLPGSVVYNVWEDKKGSFWALTPSGVSRYHPEADVEPPKTFLSAEDASKVGSTDESFVVRVIGRDKWKVTESERLLFSWRTDGGSWSPYEKLSELVFRDLASGEHRVDVRAMDRSWNEEPIPASLVFSTIVPWHREPRVLAVGLAGAVVALVFAGLAANRHRRLVRSYAEVGRIVATRTAELELANRELLHSQKMRALGTLAAGIAHDFNSILSIIKGSVQLIEIHPEQHEKVQTRVNRIKTAVDQGSGLVKAMLGLSRTTGESLVLCDINALVNEVLKLLGDQALGEIALRFEAAEPLPGVWGQRDFIKQILLNLIINANDSMTPGKGEVAILSGLTRSLPHSLALEPASAERYVYTRVVDQGAGIKSEILSRIFEPFFTTKSFSTRRGTGLGLSMVYELSKEMGFGVSVDSEVGKGSVFTVFMPVKDEPAISGSAGDS